MGFAYGDGPIAAGPEFDPKWKVMTATEAAPTPLSKKQQVIDMLKRDGGATLADIVSATDWLPHTSRAALTGLRKKGHAIVTSKVDGTTRYTLADAA